MADGASVVPVTVAIMWVESRSVATQAAASEIAGVDEGKELLKAVSLFVRAFEAQERFSVGVAMLREIYAGESSGPSRCP